MGSASTLLLPHILQPLLRSFGFFLDSISSSRYERMTGISMADDGLGGISRSKTAKAFASNMPYLLSSLYQGHKLISKFKPDIIVSDFEGSGSRLQVGALFSNS